MKLSHFYSSYKFFGRNYCNMRIKMTLLLHNYKDITVYFSLRALSFFILTLFRAYSSLRALSFFILTLFRAYSSLRALSLFILSLFLFFSRLLVLFFFIFC